MRAGVSLQFVVAAVRAVAFVWLAAGLAHRSVCEGNWLIGTELPPFAG